MQLLTEDAIQFLSDLHNAFDERRRNLLLERARRQDEFDVGLLPGFLPETKHIRESEWQVPEAPADLRDRRVEITGPVDRKMMINALNSGAKVFMADFEDATSPTWSNILEGQQNLIDAHRRTLSLDTPDKQYRLNEETATLVVRPRGWHLPEKHLEFQGRPASASLVDFGLYMYWGGREAIAAGSGPYFYLPKLESAYEARLWHDVFTYAEERLDIPPGTIRATVLIETITAAFEMEEILFALGRYASGLNAGRWDYIFSIIKRFRNRRDKVLPDRSEVTMDVPFMHAYTDLLVATCHRRGAHAIGGMAAFIPNRRDPEVTERALAKVAEDKRREAGQGFDGTWVAHPDLVPVARAEFDRQLGDRPHQIDWFRADVAVDEGDLLDTFVKGASITMDGIRTNVSVGIRYFAAWLTGTGAAAIDNLMEDAATAEISRSQIWQWVRHGATTDRGATVTPELVREVIDDTMEGLRNDLGEEAFQAGRYEEARRLFERVALSPDFVEFSTLPAYELID
ncbi:MAG TPA: malate synthase A [Acidimicrobiia bacterium]|nr:malate synthase A [Acidimicrobiia bacterium]